MAKSTPKNILFDTYTAGIFGRTEGYADRVRQLYAQAVTELLKLAASQGLSEDEMFEFDKLPKKLREEANKILRLLYTSVYNEVQHGIRAEWEYANLSNDIIIKRIFGEQVFKNEGNHFARWFGRNQQAMDAFLMRRTGKDRLGLSERIWNYTGQLKDEMELALSVSMGKGESASSVSRKVRQYLQEPERLFRHVKGKDGKMRWSKDAKAYLKEHDVGRGQYLSSYKNAMRLTRTETNMAYRSADYERWQQLDFVLGIHVQRAHREDNDKDICEILQGDYPKTFKFTGWHPQCRCIATPILATPDEMVAMRKALREGKDPRSVLAPGRYITEPPAAFTQWIDDNRERIQEAASVPYFIRENYKDGDIDKGFAWVKTKKEKTQEEKQAILEKWNERKRHNTLITKMGNNVYNVAIGYPDVDVTELVAAINGGNIAKIEAQSRAVAKQVAALNKQLKGMESLIDNPKQWLAQGFKVADLQKVFDSVGDKMSEWTAKFNGDSYLTSHYTLDSYLLKKLAYEITDIEDKQKYSTWKVAQQAYVKQQTEIQEKLIWQDIQSEYTKLSAKLSNGLYASQIAKLDQAIKNKQKDAAQLAIAELDAWADVNDVLEEALTFQTKSAPYLNLITQLKQNIASDNLTAAQTTVLAMQQKRKELKQASDRRKAKALNKPTHGIKFSDADFTKERKDNALWQNETDGSGYYKKDAGDDFFRPHAERDWARWSQEEREVAYNYTSGSSYINEPLYTTYYATKYGVHGEKRDSWHDINLLTNMIDGTDPFERDVWLNRGASASEFEGQFGIRLSDYEHDVQKAMQIRDRLTQIEKRMERIASFKTQTAAHIQEMQMLSSEQANLTQQMASLNLFDGKVGTQLAFTSTAHSKSWGFVDQGKRPTRSVVYNIYCPKGTKGIYTEPYSAFGSGSHDWNGRNRTALENELEVILQRGTIFRVLKAEYKNGQWFIDMEVIEQPTKYPNQR